ncbi:hypothetical protein MTO96_034707 [Rhipicephalus appendiculatus]
MKNRAAIANILLLGALFVPYLPAVVGPCVYPWNFDCGNGRCILPERMCNDYDNCGNNADEEGCASGSVVCPACTFACHDGKGCLPPSYVCEGRDTCRDGSDEKNCPEARDMTLNCSLCTRPEPTLATPSADTAGPTSPPSDLNTGGFWCLDGRCLRRDQVCDGVRDCSDGNDEDICRLLSLFSHQRQHDLLDQLMRSLPCQIP